MKNRIRIESHENVVRNAKVFYVPEDGPEVDISECVQGVTIHLGVGEISRATLDVILVDSLVTAEVGDVILNRLAPPKAKKRWLRRSTVETTHFGSNSRTYCEGLQ